MNSVSSVDFSSFIRAGSSVEGMSFASIVKTLMRVGWPFFSK